MTAKGLIYDDQDTLFGARDVIGYGCPVMQVQQIPVGRARDVIRANHYSGTVVNNSYVNLGVFEDGELYGVLQYGYAMNPSSASKIVEGTANDQYLELNRMWLSDRMPRNSESKAIAYSVKYIRARYPRVKWLQSFADERCGGLGVVYQACSFGYYGCHETEFWELDGTVYHRIAMTSPKRAATGVKGVVLQAGRDRARRFTLRQFRYLRFLDQSWKARCTLPELPYPKPEGL